MKIRLQPWSILFGLLTAALMIPSQAIGADWTCPKTGGIIKHGDMAYRHIDTTSRATPDGVIKYLYDSLIDVTWDLKYRPGLAAEMPTVIDDKTYEFKLRQNVKFHDGTDFNAEAVKFAMERMVAGGDQLTAASPHTGLWGKLLDRLEVVDDFTVRLYLKQPDPNFNWHVASTFFIPSPTAVKEFGKEFGIKSMAGTGPFILKSFKPKERLEVVKNPNYFRPNEPCVDEIHSIFIASGSVRLLSLRRGELTNVFTFPESQLPLIESDPKVKIFEGDASTLTILVVNTKIEKLADKRVRQALQYAVDGQEIIDKVYRGRGAMVESLFPPWHFAYRPMDDLSIIRQDQAKARELLKQAGYGPDNPLKIDLQTYPAPAHVERSVVLQDQFKGVGIETNVRNLPTGTVQENLFSSNFEVVLYQFRGGTAVGSYSWELFAGASSANPSGYNQEGGPQNKEMERVFAEAAAMLDTEKGAELAATMQRQAFEDAPYIYLNWRNHREAFNPDRVKNHNVSHLKNRQDWRQVWLDE